MPKLNPLLESDAIECAHKGKVLLQSSTKDLMCVQDSNNNESSMISLSDLANASIVGCTNNIAGIPSPCIKLVNIPNSIASTLLEIDNQKIVIAQYISQVLTDKGSPLILQGEPKAKDIFEVEEDNAENVQNGNDSAESTNESSKDSNADSSNSQSTQDSQTNTNEDKKSEIDLRGQTTPNGGIVEWISQFDDKIKKDYGKSGCNAVSRLILSKSGLGENSGANSNTYILAQEMGRELKTEATGTNLRHNKFIKTADGQIDTTQQQSYLKISPSNILKEAIAYIDS